MMKSFLLLILSLMKGCEASSDVNVCQESWVEFTLKYPKTNGNYQTIDVVVPKSTTIQSSQKDVWETKGRVSLFHDTKNKNLRVAIKQLQREDFGDYKGKFYKRPNSSNEKDVGKVELEVEEVGCKKPLIQTAYRTAKTSITCDHPNKYRSSVKFFCKENGVFCEDILSTKSSLKSNGTFTLKHTNSGFIMSISNVSSQHAGVYWCGVESIGGSYRAALRQIQLEVEATITNLTRSPTIGQNLTYLCRYPHGAYVKKFICKGEDPSICQIAGTTQPNKNTGKFSLKDDRVKRIITITVREVATEDTGTYWCGAESTDTTHRFYHRLLMTVVPPTRSTPSILSSTSRYPVATASVSSTQSTPVSAERDGYVITAVVVCVAVLVLVFILVLVYKRVERSKNIRNGEAQNNKEDGIYEEIQEHPQRSDSGTASKTIYVTANFPTNLSAFKHNSTVTFQNSSGTCSTVTDNAQCPTFSTVNHPSRCSEDPFYSTVNNPQQHFGKP